jgi:hypothetical protein
MATVKVNSRLPFGLILEVGDTTQEINGLNKAIIIGAEYASTEVDEQFWAAWCKANAKHPCLENNSLFVGKSDAEIKAKAVEAKGSKTGLEPLEQNSGGVVVA